MFLVYCYELSDSDTVNIQESYAAHVNEGITSIGDPTFAPATIAPALITPVTKSKSKAFGSVWCKD